MPTSSGRTCTMPTRGCGSITASAGSRRRCHCCTTPRCGNSPSWSVTETFSVMAQLVIFGPGDIARLAHRYFTRDSGHEVVAFTVDAAYRAGDEFLGLPLVDFDQV